MKEKHTSEHIYLLQFGCRINKYSMVMLYYPNATTNETLKLNKIRL